jgi:hypothetical protein
MGDRWKSDNPRGFDPTATGSSNQAEGVVAKAIQWLKQRIFAAALSAAATIAFISFISPAWLDFMFDLIMIGLIYIVGKLAKSR